MGRCLQDRGYEMTDETPEIATTVRQEPMLPAVVAPMQLQPVTLFGDATPAQIIGRATEAADALAAVIKAKNLSKRIGDREHVFVEGWTLCGSMLGVFPVVVWTRQITKDGGPWGWESRVEARTASGAVVGAAESQCTRDEAQWSFQPVNKWGKKLTARDDYALRSMAQTRATSKALRLPLGFIMVLAGYDATPADEMPDKGESGAVAGDSTRLEKQSAAPTLSGEEGPYGGDGFHCPECGAEIKQYESASAKYPGRLYLQCEGAHFAIVERREQGQTMKDILADMALRKHYGVKRYGAEPEWAEAWVNCDKCGQHIVGTIYADRGSSYYCEGCFKGGESQLESNLAASVGSGQGSVESRHAEGAAPHAPADPGVSQPESRPAPAAPDLPILEQLQAISNDVAKRVAAEWKE